MIGEDRIGLNNRFIKVFQLLEERGAIIKNDRKGRGIGDVAEKILGNRGYGHIVRAFLNENDKRVISYSQARKFCREFGINEDYLLDGTGTPFGFDLPRSSNEQGNFTRGNILFTTVEAFAGSTLGPDSFDTEDTSWFSLPGLQGNGLVAFQINGNSMEPLINDNDLVVCREVDRLETMDDNDIYAVKNNGSLWVKHVQRIFHGNRITHLKLISANHLEHDPFVEEVNMHTRLYKVIRKISDF
ncbi:MAG TPA: LexA family transcriptional regulator [Bacteroidetes bacterium]|nr:LexA family transcriptional regulator [Bacteroidota bacterium]